MWFRSSSSIDEFSHWDGNKQCRLTSKYVVWPEALPPFHYTITTPRLLRCQLLTNCPCYTNNILFISGTSFILLVLGLWPVQTLTRTLSVPGIRSSFIITVRVLSQILFIQYIVYPSHIWPLYQLCQPSKFNFTLSMFHLHLLGWHRWWQKSTVLVH